MMLLADLLQSRWDVCGLLKLAAVFLCLCWLWRPRHLPPGPVNWPLLGNFLSLTQDEPMLLMTWARQYGDVFMYHVGSRAVVVLNGYRTIQQALVKQAEDFSSRPYMPITAQNSQKKGVIHVPYSPFWKQHRKLTLLKMREIGVDKPVLDQKIAAEGKCLVQEILKKDGKPFNMTKIIQTAVSNIISTMLCGTRYEYDHPGFQRFIANVALNFKFSRLSMLPNHYPWTKWVPGLNTEFNQTLECNQEIRDHIREQLVEHVTSFDPSNIRDFMDAYLDEIRHQDDKNSTVNEDQLVQVIRDMFVAGIENIATALRWALLYSVLYPDIQAKVQEEIDQVLGGGGTPTMADRKKMPYTEATIEEVLRYATVAPLTVDHATSRDTTLNGYYIPKDTLVQVNLWSVHHDPDIWTEPEKFDPRRFLDNTGQFQKKAENIPFSLGRRICLGERLARAELLLLFILLLQHFNFKLPEGATRPPEKGVFGITYNPVDFDVVAVPRVADT
ncbi:PREDICTED: cytochrome P450 2U1-like [Branchiostoma belcheri]|uniref:Cytochrome P450 2U1 n=1 Tax=Branchiostoma belcheri TaxID=7741 RepID=A0A6P4ZXI4_BRABE|nr:PREDICTED: cytochrome P450 2U1-like [Branchiostoma belcheri]